MAKIVIMPQAGETMEEGTVREWLKKEGDPVKKGEILFAIDTDKAYLEVESDYSGILKKILVTQEDGSVPCLTPVGIIGEPDEIIDPVKIVEEYRAKQSKENEPLNF